MKFLIFTLIFSIWTLVPGAAIHCDAEIKYKICSTEGKTYENQCLFGSTRNAPLPIPPATILHGGECDTEKPTCGCPSYYEPICGTDGRTWPNKCLLDCAKDKPQPHFITEIEMKHEGDCSLETPCTCGTESVDLVCGTDNLTYKNKCVLDCVAMDNYGSYHKLALKKTGKC